MGRRYEHLSDAQAAFPQLGPVGDMQFLAFVTAAVEFFAAIFFGSDLIEHDIWIGDAGEGNLQAADEQRFKFGLIAAVNSRQQSCCQRLVHISACRVLEAALLSSYRAGQTRRQTTWRWSVPPW